MAINRLSEYSLMKMAGGLVTCMPLCIPQLPDNCSANGLFLGYPSHTQSFLCNNLPLVLVSTGQNAYAGTAFSMELISNGITSGTIISTGYAGTTVRDDVLGFVGATVYQYTLDYTIGTLDTSKLYSTVNSCGVYFIGANIDKLQVGTGTTITINIYAAPVCSTTWAPLWSNGVPFNYVTGADGNNYVTTAFSGDMRTFYTIALPGGKKLDIVANPLHPGFALVAQPKLATAVITLIAGGASTIVVTPTAGAGIVQSFTAY